ncbi:COG1188 Ribosome-associated heat shock protein implicated in the recycling of the 50S subunit (S4 paralog) [Sphingomonadaceae bacterium]|uniref:RNA-binding S4 domain-containing protein n=1 Tax=Sphingorhabdus sp. TaxID=1902408 RepID=UPI0030863D8D|nr:RNA-binding S4 domain-containing protein [Sphingomonadales bacterium]WRH75627.1 MAG: RNA-binding S4 domain-containing protein [Sphingobium sp.]
MALASLRIDKLLWHLRLSKSRSLAQVLVAEGHIRLNGRRVEKPSAEVKVGDALTIPRGDAVLAIRVVAIPPRRGPASEAQACYLEI